MASTGQHSLPPHCALGTIPTFKHLPGAVLDDLAGACRAVPYKSGRALFHEGDGTNSLGCVCTGILRRQKTFPDGRQHIVDLLARGDLFNKFEASAKGYAIEAATDALVLLFRRDCVDAIAAAVPEWQEVLLDSVLADLQRARDMLTIVASHRRRGRLAGFLLLLCTRNERFGNIVRRVDGHLTVRIPINRTDLANILGMRVESISRGLRHLENSGSIRILETNLVAIPDLDRLVEEAGNGDLLLRSGLQDLRDASRRES